MCRCVLSRCLSQKSEVRYYRPGRSGEPSWPNTSCCTTRVPATKIPTTITHSRPPTTRKQSVLRKDTVDREILGRFTVKSLASKENRLRRRFLGIQGGGIVIVSFLRK